MAGREAGRQAEKIIPDAREPKCGLTLNYYNQSTSIEF